MNNSLEANTIVGFLGAGQLARMSAAAAFRMGLRSAVYSGAAQGPEDPQREPLEWMTPIRHPGRFDEELALIRFAESCDVVTLENEFLDGALLHRVRAASGTPIYPSPESFMQLESKWLEKETFRRAGIPVTPCSIINEPADMQAFADTHGHPFVLKSSKGGYDGYGNITVSAETEHLKAFRSLGGDKGRELIAEAFISFEKELAVQVARNHTGSVVYPCCETIQKNHICKTVIAPAAIGSATATRACEMALAATEAIDGTGLFAFEFFLTTDGELLLNESAPRPHNSGHYTIEGCITSQFENHIRAVLGLPLGAPDMRRPVAVMENLLGSHDRPARVDGAEGVWMEKDAHLHIYGKEQSRKGRKMGHITVLGDDHETTIQTAGRLAGTVEI
ncbi:5-(carboxyamino)imidazole ribonucleotide synthase [Balneolales bacterium ANBcel1]|nr:5-(carboxyamino)imidazole ribonucleotide synthase [Balneolales bacterium ANBcel1]